MLCLVRYLVLCLLSYVDAVGSNATTKHATQKDVELAMRKFFTGARDRGSDGRKRTKAATVSLDNE